MKITKYFLFQLLLILLLGCSNTEMKRDFQQLQSKAISFPSKLNFTVHGKDTVIPVSVKYKFKLVVYTDSIGCSSCVVSKMYLWNSFIEKSELYKDKLKIYYILSPRKQHIKRVRTALSMVDFDYPILLDTLGEFEKLNPHLPKNKALHTFLLDENNNVILVGSPLHNKKIEEMFYRIVEEKLGKPE